MKKGNSIQQGRQKLYSRKIYLAIHKLHTKEQAKTRWGRLLCPCLVFIVFYIAFVALAWSFLGIGWIVLGFWSRFWLVGFGFLIHSTVSSVIGSTFLVWIRLVLVATVIKKIQLVSVNTQSNLSVHVPECWTQAHVLRGRLWQSTYRFFLLIVFH